MVIYIDRGDSNDFYLKRIEIKINREELNESQVEGEFISISIRWNMEKLKEIDESRLSNIT